MISATPSKFANWPSTPVKQAALQVVVNLRLLLGKALLMAQEAICASLPALLVA
jgi:hypothetical protein